MVTHELKTWPEYYEAVLRGDKTFEVRVDDRGGYDVGDVLVLHEWDRHGRGYTGRVCDVVVRYVLRDPKFGVAPGYVVMGIGAPAEVVRHRRVNLTRMLDAAAVLSLWAALLTLRAAWPVAVVCQVIATVFVGASLFARGRS